MQVLGPHPGFLNQRLWVFKQQQLVVTSHPGGPDPGSSEHCCFTSEKWPLAGLPQTQAAKTDPLSRV